MDGREMPAVLDQGPGDDGGPRAEEWRPEGSHCSAKVNFKSLMHPPVCFAWRINNTIYRGAWMAMTAPPPATEKAWQIMRAATAGGNAYMHKWQAGESSPRRHCHRG
jgi:hypothetical protein